MRIAPGTGDLPAVVAIRPVGVQADSVTAAPAVMPALPAVAAAAAAGAGTGAGGDDRSDRQRRQGETPLRPVFDPPLIAQRAVLGLPIGPMVAGLALQQGIAYAAAADAVDRAVEAQQGAVPERHDGPPPT